MKITIIIITSILNIGAIFFAYKWGQFKEKARLCLWVKNKLESCNNAPPEKQRKVLIMANELREYMDQVT